MAVTPATLFGTEMALLTANAGGNIQSLLQSYLSHGKDRIFIANIPLVGQLSGVVIGVARLPLPMVLTGAKLLSDTSLGSSTIALGNAGNGNAAKYKAAGTFTSTDTPTSFGLTASMGVPITSGFDCLTGAATGYTQGAQGGALYEDIIMTVGVANLPGSGNLRIFFTYAID